MLGEKPNILKLAEVLDLMDAKQPGFWHYYLLKDVSQQRISKGNALIWQLNNVVFRQEGANGFYRTKRLFRYSRVWRIALHSDG